MYVERASGADKDKSCACSEWDALSRMISVVRGQGDVDRMAYGSRAVRLWGSRVLCG